MAQKTTETFREQRLKRGWTLPELAAKCTEEGAKTDDGNLSRIERGEQVPRPRLRAVLAELLELEIDYFDQEAS